MEKIIFFGLVIPILAFVLYLGGTAIMNGFSAKNANKSIERDEEETEDVKDSDNNTNQLSSELNKLPEELKYTILSYLPACKYKRAWYGCFESYIDNFNRNLYRPYRKNHPIYNPKIEYPSSDESEDEEARTHVRYYALY